MKYVSYDRWLEKFHWLSNHRLVTSVVLTWNKSITSQKYVNESPMHYRSQPPRSARAELRCRDSSLQAPPPPLHGYHSYPHTPDHRLSLSHPRAQGRCEKDGRPARCGVSVLVRPARSYRERARRRCPDVIRAVERSRFAPVKISGFTRSLRRH